LAEAVGVWVVNRVLRIPPDRLIAANYVFQITIFSMCFSILTTPYRSMVVAMEKMHILAWLSIGEALIKLTLVMLLYVYTADRLIAYACCILICNIIIFGCYAVYCRHLAPEATKFYLVKNGQLFRGLFSFSGWSFFGGVANVGAIQGLDIVVNIFSNVGVNAALGIAKQVYNAMWQFVGSFQTAYVPQLMKLHAAKQQEELVKLSFRASKLSFILVLLVSLPLIVNADFVLKIWLGIVPEYSVTFLRLWIIYMLIESPFAPLVTLIQANGNIRAYQIIVSTMFLSILPLSVLALFMGLPIWSVLVIKDILILVICLWRTFFVGRRVNLPIRKYFVQVLLRTLTTAVLCFACVLPLRFSLSELPLLVTSSTLSVICVLSWGTLLLLRGDERTALVSFIKSHLGASRA